MEKRTKLKELEMYSKFFGEKYHIILKGCQPRDTEDAIKTLVKALPCSAEYAKESLREMWAAGEVSVYASHLERCELILRIFERDGVSFDTELIKD
jgi:hypothetical protein